MTSSSEVLSSLISELSLTSASSSSTSTIPSLLDSASLNDDSKISVPYTNKVISRDSGHQQRVSRALVNARQRRGLVIEAKRTPLSGILQPSEETGEVGTAKLLTVSSLLKTSKLLQNPVIDDFEQKGAKAGTLLNSSDANKQLEGMIYFRKCLSLEQDPPISQVIAMGVVPRVVALLNEGSSPDELKFEAAWVLTNIASGTSSHCQTVVRSGGVDAFINVLKFSKSESLLEQVIWGLGNIAGDSVALRNQLNNSQVIDLMVSRCSDITKISTLRNFAWSLSNLCRGKPAPDLTILKPALPALAKLIFSSDDEVVTDATWALSYISDGPNEAIEAVLQHGVLPRVVELLSSSTNTIVIPALRTIGNFVTGTDTQTQKVLNQGVLPVLLNLLKQTNKNTLKKEIVWTVSNITAGSPAQIQMVMDSGFIAILHQLTKTTTDIQIKKEIVWAISNLFTGATNAQAQFVVDQGWIPVAAILLQTTLLPNCMVCLLEGLQAMVKKIANPHQVFEPLAEIVVEISLAEDYNVANAATKLLNMFEGGFEDDEIPEEEQDF